MAFFSLAKGPSASTSRHLMKTSQYPLKSLQGEPGCRVMVLLLKKSFHFTDPVLAHVSGRTGGRGTQRSGRRKEKREGTKEDQQSSLLLRRRTCARTDYKKGGAKAFWYQRRTGPSFPSLHWEVLLHRINKEELKRADDGSCSLEHTL